MLDGDGHADDDAGHQPDVGDTEEPDGGDGRDPPENRRRV
jgi:hypothetical protein